MVVQNIINIFFTTIMRLERFALTFAKGKVKKETYHCNNACIEPVVFRKQAFHGKFAVPNGAVHGIVQVLGQTVRVFLVGVRAEKRVGVSHATDVHVHLKGYRVRVFQQDGRPFGRDIVTLCPANAYPVFVPARVLALLDLAVRGHVVDPKKSVPGGSVHQARIHGVRGRVLSPCNTAVVVAWSKRTSSSITSMGLPLSTQRFHRA